MCLLWRITLGFAVKPAERKGDATAHVACSEFAMSLHTETCMFSREAMETGKALFDGGPTRSMGSWDALDGLARMNEQLYGSHRFSLDRTGKTWYTFAHGERQQSQGEVAFQVDAGGRMGDCKIACLNTTGVPILLSVQSLSKMVTIIDFSTAAAFFWNLTYQVFVQLERGQRASSSVIGERHAIAIIL